MKPIGIVLLCGAAILSIGLLRPSKPATNAPYANEQTSSGIMIGSHDDAESVVAGTPSQVALPMFKQHQRQEPEPISDLSEPIALPVRVDPDQTTGEIRYHLTMENRRRKAECNAIKNALIAYAQIHGEFPLETAPLQTLQDLEILEWPADQLSNDGQPLDQYGNVYVVTTLPGRLFRIEAAGPDLLRHTADDLIYTNNP